MTTSPRIKYQQGDHVCTLYSNRDEQLAAAVAYIREGLARGERCLYVVCEHTPDEFREGLRSAGIDVEAEEARGALLLLTRHEGPRTAIGRQRFPTEGADLATWLRIH